MTQPAPTHCLPAQRLPLVWLALLLLTLLSYYGLSRFAERVFVPLVLAAMWLKGQLLVEHFMGLSQVSGFWRALMALYVAGVTMAIGLAFLLD
jgi:predicted membrane protein